MSQNRYICRIHEHFSDGKETTTIYLSAFGHTTDYKALAYQFGTKENAKAAYCFWAIGRRRVSCKVIQVTLKDNMYDTETQVPERKYVVDGRPDLLSEIDTEPPEEKEDRTEYIIEFMLTECMIEGRRDLLSNIDKAFPFYAAVEHLMYNYTSNIGEARRFTDCVEARKLRNTQVEDLEVLTHRVKVIPAPVGDTVTFVTEDGYETHPADKDTCTRQRYVVQLAEGTYGCDEDFRTTLLCNAKQFKKQHKAYKIMGKLQNARNWPDAKVVPVLRTVTVEIGTVDE